MGIARAPREAHHLAGLDGLRGIAALALLAYHVWVFALGPALDGATSLPAALRAGLILFFLLSGLVIYRPYAAALLRGDRLPDLRRYLRHRALRILPAYWVVLLLSSYVLQTTFTRFPFEMGPITDPLVLLADLALLQGLDLETANSGIGPAWSLAVEASFYLCVPVLGAAALSFAPRLRGWAAPLLPIAALAVVGLVTRVALATGAVPAGEPDLLVSLSLLAHADLFALGMLVALWRVALDDGRLRAPAPHAHRALLLAAAAMLAGIAVSGAVEGVYAGDPTDLLVAVPCALILAGVVAPASRRAPAALEHPALRKLGMWSFSVFLWHTPLMFFLMEHVGLAGTWAEAAAMLAAVTAASIAAAALTYRFVERPALARKDPRPASGTPQVAVATEG